MDNGLAWAKLQINVGLANTVEDIDRNVEYALTRDYTPFQALLEASAQIT